MGFEATLFRKSTAAPEQFLQTFDYSPSAIVAAVKDLISNPLLASDQTNAQAFNELMRLSNREEKDISNSEEYLQLVAEQINALGLDQRKMTGIKNQFKHKLEANNKLNPESEQMAA